MILILLKYIFKNQSNRFWKFIAIFLISFMFIILCQILFMYLNKHIILGFPGGSDGKETACNAGDLGSIPGLGRSPGEGKAYG